jgi:hypothetical protein
MQSMLCVRNGIGAATLSGGKPERLNEKGIE